MSAQAYKTLYRWLSILQLIFLPIFLMVLIYPYLFSHQRASSESMETLTMAITIVVVVISVARLLVRNHAFSPEQVQSQIAFARKFQPAKLSGACLALLPIFSHWHTPESLYFMIAGTIIWLVASLISFLAGFHHLS
jgi:hypothetical protein